MLAGNDGTFTLRGQYFVGGDGIDYPNRAQGFSYSAPLVGPGLNGVATAQSQVILELAEDIAKRISR